MVVGKSITALVAMAAVAAVPRHARADSLSDELVVGTAHAGAVGPSTPFVGDRARLSVDFGDLWSTRAGVGFTHYDATSSSSSQDVFQLSAGTTFEPSDHAAFGLDATLSPRSTGTTDVPVTIPGPPEKSSAVKLLTGTLSAGAVASVEYDTAGDSDAETVLEGDVGATWYSIEETGKNKALQAECSTGSTRACGYLTAPGVSLLQLTVSAGVTETLSRSTDLDLYGTYFVYTSDPAAIGYTAGTYSTTPLAGGVPSQPLLFLVQPGVVHWFGSVGLGLSSQYGNYVDELGYSIGGGLKVTVKIGRTVKLWGGANFQRDDEQGAASYTGWGTAGARVRF